MRMTALVLKLLGEFDARDAAGRPVILSGRKNRALLAALALAPSCSISRERIARLLWSDRGDAQAYSSLRQALLALRKDFAAISPSPLSATHDRVKLEPAVVDIDAVEFQQLATSSNVAELRRAAALYRGELLADTYIRDATFEEWVASERQRLADIACDVLERLCAREAGAARIDVAKQLVALSPLREASHRTLMQAYSEGGEQALAVRQYEICRDLLAKELHVEPQPQTEILHRRLLQGSSGAPGTAVDRSAVDNVAAVPSRDDKPAVAVLPLVASGDAELDSFSDGLTEDIITGLSRISTIKVIARNTMFSYKNRTVAIRDVGRELGARYVVEGSVRRSENRIRVSAQLSDAANAYHIWAQQIDRVFADAFDVQDEVTKSIVASVQTQLILNEGRVSAAGQSADHASQLLARSWQRFLMLTAESLADARALAERALELDGRSGLGHRMLAVCLYHQAYMGFVPWTEQVIAELYSHAKISIEADDADEYCHWAMQCAHLLKKDHERAIASLRRSLEINPHCSLAYGAMGTVLAWAGQYDSSIERNELALRINPQDPTVFYRHFGLALAHYLASRYDEALVHAGMVLETRPSWWLGQLIYCASLAQLGRTEEASRILDELKRARPDMSAASLNILPFASTRDRQHLIGGLSKAGLVGDHRSRT